MDYPKWQYSKVKQSFNVKKKEMQILVNTDQYSIRWPSIQGMRQSFPISIEVRLFNNGQKKGQHKCWPFK
jgi:hypothetical protein